MKKVLTIMAGSSILVVSLFAANKGLFLKKKQKEITILQKREILIKKRLQCVKSAKNNKQLVKCKKAFPLVNRKKLKKKMKKLKNKQIKTQIKK
jgi:hypothetical protein